MRSRGIISDLSFLLLFLVLGGCLGPDSDDNENNPWIMPLDSGIVFAVKEGYRSNDTVSEPEIVLFLQTECVYPCCNWTVASHVCIKHNEIVVNILGVEKYAICFTVISVAKSKIFLNISEGNYILKLTYKDIEDTYSLEVTDSSISVTEYESHFTRPALNLFWRYPPNSFAYLCGTTIDDKWICNDFLDTLLSVVKLREFQFPDSGQVPYLAHSMGHYYDADARYFYYEKSEDFDRAGEILETYIKDVVKCRSGMGLSLINWKNKRYHSWHYCY